VRELVCVCGGAWVSQTTHFGEALTLVPCFVSHKRTAVAWSEALQRLPNWVGGRQEAVLIGDHRPKRGAAEKAEFNTGQAMSEQGACRINEKGLHTRGPP